MDDEGNVLAEKSRQEGQIKKLDENVTKLLEITEHVQLEINDI